jgi:hypothetical protein
MIEEKSIRSAEGSPAQRLIIVGATISLALSTVLISPARANPLIATAVEEKLLDEQTALLYELYEVLEPQSLPAEYRQSAPGPLSCGTPLMTRAAAGLDEFGEEYRLEAAKILQARPTLETSTVSPSGHFRVHYSLNGFDAVDPTDEDGNGLPDFIDLAAAGLDSAWRLQIDLLGYREPPSDEGAGGGTEYDVYVVELGTSGKYGFVRAEQSTPRPFSFMQIDNNYTDANVFGRVSNCFGVRGTSGTAALNVTTAHEFFHAVQFAYYHGNDGIWWEEASATWMEEVAYPEADDYLQYVCDFLLAPDRSLDSGSAFSQGTRIYGASIFAHFLDQRYGSDIIRRIWDQNGRRTSASTDNFDRVLRSVVPAGLAEVVSEFAVWNYFTGVRHREQFYAEGDKWPAINVQATSLNLTDGIVQGRVDHLASAYIKFEPQLLPGGLVLDTRLERGGWRRQIVLVSGDSVDVVQSFDNVTPLTISDWDTYDEVVLILTNTERVGIGFEYTITAEYDGGLSERPIPVAFSLGDSYPNPFRPQEHTRLTIPFELKVRSFLNSMTIFSADGDLIRRFELRSLEPNAHVQAWDGRNEAGKLVSSGIYYCVFEADGIEAKGTVTLIRD